MGDQLGEMVFLSKSDKGVNICRVDFFGFAATGIAGEKGECVSIYADSILAHSKIAFG